MFTAALFIIVKNWIQSKCTSTDELINKIWNISKHKILFSHKRNKVLIHAISQVNFENIMRSQRTQSYKVTYTLFKSIYMKCPEQANPLRQKADVCLPGAGRRKERAVTVNGYRFFFGGDENVLQLVVIAQLCEY